MTELAFWFGESRKVKETDLMSIYCIIIVKLYIFI